uniref:Uncharacterized protein n=1 Tax=Cacopsylla melanoneura TaxID=428564 RepID=A0A8D9E8K1_9HEMI
MAHDPCCLVLLLCIHQESTPLLHAPLFPSHNSRVLFGQPARHQWSETNALDRTQHPQDRILHADQLHSPADPLFCLPQFIARFYTDNTNGVFGLLETYSDLVQDSFIFITLVTIAGVGTQPFLR